MEATPTNRAAPLPANEERRLATLAGYALLDTQPETQFDLLAARAARACAVPIALIVLIDRERQWFKANVGMTAWSETPRAIALCAHSIVAQGLTEICDVAADNRFAHNPLVVGEPFIRFYAGVPLTVADGQTLGTLCVIDRKPRVLEDHERCELLEIGSLVVAGFEERRRGLDASPGGSVPPPEAPASERESSLELLNARLTTLTAVARTVFASLDPRALVDALVAGVAELTAGGTSTVLARGTDAEFIPTSDLSSSSSTPFAGDAFIRATARHDGVLLAPDGRRAGVPIVGPSGIVAYILDIRAGGRSFAQDDAFVFGLLGQYLAVAARNVALYGELTGRRAAVIELNQVKNDLIAMLAHDFKGPLTTIVGLTDVLAEDERFDSESRRLLGIINSSAMRLARLAGDTLALSHVEQNELALRFDRVDILAQLREIVRVLGVTRTIGLRLPEDELPIVRADASRMRQVFENIIGNAIKYSPQGEPVDVTVRAKDGGIEVAVRDRGIGIVPADLPKLFGRFARGSNARERGIGGTGFGLYLSRTIVELHGGRISVESTLDAGSTFRIFVPSVPAPQRTLDRRVVLLDCEEAGRSFIAHTLRNDGYAVRSVADEDELLRALNEERYDAAIVDVDGLVMTPEALLAAIAHRTTLVRLVSTPESGGTGWNAALPKPFLIRDLQVVLESAVAERRRVPREPAERESG